MSMRASDVNCMKRKIQSMLKSMFQELNLPNDLRAKYPALNGGKIVSLDELANCEIKSRLSGRNPDCLLMPSIWKYNIKLSRVHAELLQQVPAPTGHAIDDDYYS